MTTFRRVKKMDYLLEDPNTPYRIGQLIGVCEMTAHWMSLQEDKDTKAMGTKMHGALNWFFEEVEVKE